jgi:hypothetical protein
MIFPMRRLGAPYQRILSKRVERGVAGKTGARGGGF